MTSNWKVPKKFFAKAEWFEVIHFSLNLFLRESKVVLTWLWDIYWVAVSPYRHPPAKNYLCLLRFQKGCLRLECESVFHWVVQIAKTLFPKPTFPVRLEKLWSKVHWVFSFVRGRFFWGKIVTKPSRGGSVGDFLKPTKSDLEISEFC